MDKDSVIEILDELYNDIQSMRENGETDIRSVLHRLDFAISKIDKL